MSVFNAVNASIYSTLGGGTALVTALGGTAIYQGAAPDHAALPYVVYSHQAGGALNITPDDMRDQIVFVRAYAATAKQAGEIDALCSALLHHRVLSVTGWTNFWTARETDVEQVITLADGRREHSAGAFYRIRLT